VARDNSLLKPKFKRQLIFAVSVLTALPVLYWAILSLLDVPHDQKQLSPHANVPEAWYKSQSSPPAMIATPDLPVFPGGVPQEGKAIASNSAFVETLPKEVYELTAEHSASAILPGSASGVKLSKEYTASLNPMGSHTAATALPRWQKFAVATTTSSNKPLIAIVIDDMGVDRKRSDMAIGLKAPLTLSFLTYAKDLKDQTERARLRGHELLLHVSMEPRSSKVDLGPNALLINLSDQELRRRLDWGFSRFPNYVGLNNHMGSKFTSDVKSMRIVIEETKRRGLLFLDSRTSSKTVGAKLARELGVPAVERNIFLDHENNINAVNTQLAQAEKIARRIGAVVAIGHPRDATIKALQTWLKSVESKGFQLVPLTTIVKKFAKP
jgi:polysaccharide deacetylase 2 family uncharacterized protein YibQ